MSRVRHVGSLWIADGWRVAVGVRVAAEQVGRRRIMLARFNAEMRVAAHSSVDKRRGLFVVRFRCGSLRSSCALMLLDGRSKQFSVVCGRGGGGRTVNIGLQDRFDRWSMVCVCQREIEEGGRV